MFQSWVGFSPFGEVSHLRHLSTVLHTDTPAQATVSSSHTIHTFPCRKARLGCCWIQLVHLHLCSVPPVGYRQNWGFPFPGPLKQSAAKVHILSLFLFIAILLREIRRTKTMKWVEKSYHEQRISSEKHLQVRTGTTLRFAFGTQLVPPQYYHSANT